MNEENSDQMLPEYDVRGGVRGKYFDRYHQGTKTVPISFENSPIVASLTTGAPTLGAIVASITPIELSRPGAQPGNPVPVGARENSSR